MPMKKWSALIIGLLALAFFGCDALGGGQVVFRINNATNPETLDPHLISGVPEHRIYTALFEGLYQYDPRTSEPKPALAESYTLSEDGTVYTFTLRDAKWSDGSPITAQQFVDSWIRFIDPATAAEYAFMMHMMVKNAEAFSAGEVEASEVGVRAIDDKTLEVTLNASAPYFLGMLAHYAFAVVPTDLVAEKGSDWIKVENIISNGPFKLQTYNPGEPIIVVKNDLYWDAENVKLDVIEFHPIEDLNTAHAMYNAGDLDWDTDIPQDAIENARTLPGYQNNAAFITYYYVFNTQRAPFDNPEVRKALSMAIDRNELVEKVTRGGQVPAFTIVPPIAGYTPPSGNGEDFEMARNLLSDAGYPNGQGFPSFQILYNTSESHKAVAEYIQQKWKEVLNIDVELVNQEWGTYLDSRQQGNFDVARAGWQGDYIDANSFLDMFITGSDLNGGRFSNPEFDRLIEEAVLAGGGAERQEILARAEEILIDQEQAIMPIYYYAALNMIDTNKWGGWYTNTLDIHPVKYIYRK
jgi:oligopeptide transport system substrate-binding protein